MVGRRPPGSDPEHHAVPCNTTRHAPRHFSPRAGASVCTPSLGFRSGRALRGVGAEVRTTGTLQIEDDLAAGPRAAQQRIAGGRGLQRVGLVVHRARQQSGFAGMANPVRQDQRVGTSQASASSSRLRVRRIPRHGQAAPSERDQWP